MKTRGGAITLIGLLVATLAGFALLFHLRLDHGDTLPRASTLRSDALGLRALHDSLERLPGMTVRRTLEPLAELPARPARTIVIAGLEHGRLARFDLHAARALDQAARAGCRIVFAMRDVKAEFGSPPMVQENTSTEADGAGKDEAPAKPADSKKRDEKWQDAGWVDLGRWWEVRPEVRWMAGAAMPAESAPDGATTLTTWSSDVAFLFPLESAWTVQYRRGNHAVLIERRVGLGSVVLAGSAYFLSNEALQRERSAALLAWAIGPHRVVEFQEAHLGMVRESGVAALARGYGLTGAFLVFVVAAALFVWHRMAWFVPPAEERDEVGLSYHQTAGLESLLRRAVAPGEVLEACVAQWRKSARPTEVAKAEAVLARDGRAGAVETYNAIMRVLRRKGRDGA